MALATILLAVDALKQSRSKQLTLVVPFSGYARQDVLLAGGGLAAKLVPKLLRAAGASRLLLLDPHSTASVRAIPQVKTVSALPALAAALKYRAKNAVVLAPDRGARLRAMQFAALLGGLPTAFIDKDKRAPGARTRVLRGTSVNGRPVIIIDDIIDTGRTIVAAAALARAHGATMVQAAATHGLFGGEAARRISACCAEVVVTNSLPVAAGKKIRVVDCAPLLAKALRQYV
jgi:ribose-phosphate pyrophosphokinase